MRMTGMALQVVRSDGLLALYNGLSASLCRQVPAGLPWVRAQSPRAERPPGQRGGLARTCCASCPLGARGHRSSFLLCEAAQEGGARAGSWPLGGRRAGGVGCAAPPAQPAGDCHLQVGKLRQTGSATCWPGGLLVVPVVRVMPSQLGWGGQGCTVCLPCPAPPPALSEPAPPPR